MTSPNLVKWLARAEAHLAAGRHNAARREFAAVAAKFPTCTEANFQLAVILHDQDDLNGAVRHFRKLLDLKPDLAEVQYNLGTLLSRMGRRDEARRCEQIEVRAEFAPGGGALKWALRRVGPDD